MQPLMVFSPFCLPLVLAVLVSVEELWEPVLDPVEVELCDPCEPELVELGVDPLEP